MKQPKIQTLQRGFVALVLLTLLGCSPEDADIMPAAASTTQVPVYKDGTYTAVGTYGGLPSHLTVTVNLQQGLITQVQVQTHATDPTSLDYQRRFADAVPPVVVGKLLKDVQVGKLAGSSGCPIGFNDALDQIRKQAT
jgi:uncharacterized protein with FMN-binding domain